MIRTSIKTDRAAPLKCGGAQLLRNKSCGSIFIWDGDGFLATVMHSYRADIDFGDIITIDNLDKFERWRGEFRAEVEQTAFAGEDSVASASTTVDAYLRSMNEAADREEDERNDGNRDDNLN